MAILVSVHDAQGRGIYEFGAENDKERLRWEIGEHGQLAIIQQGLKWDDNWHDERVLRVFNARFWSDVEIVE